MASLILENSTTGTPISKSAFNQCKNLMYLWPCRWIAYCSRTFPAKAHVFRVHRNDSRTVNADQIVIFPEGTTTFKPNDTFAEEPRCREHNGTAVKSERPRYNHQRSESVASCSSRQNDICWLVCACK